MFRSVCQGTSEGTYCILEDDDGDTWIYINPGQSQWTDNMIQKADPKWLEDKRKNSVGIMLWKKINHQKEKKKQKTQPSEFRERRKPTVICSLFYWKWSFKQIWRKVMKSYKQCNKEWRKAYPSPSEMKSVTNSWHSVNRNITATLLRRPGQPVSAKSIIFV